ncbi:MAG: hypothetical protein HFF42_03760 [Lawsonibacter sp.]|jgi:hypothetical protein|nr:hypothetical protein [Lawsonibacter sp.]
MNEQMPRTPFSTPLSGSARETEIRLRNIFSGPKRRPPALFLALMFSVCIFCGNLVSCQVKDVEPDQPDIPAEWDDLAPPDLSMAQVDWDNLPELEPIYTGKGPRIEIEGLEGVHADWNRSSVYDPRSSGNTLYFGGDPAFCCPSLAGRTADGSAQWRDESGGAVSVSIIINDDRLEGGTINGYYLQFTADWGKQTVSETSFTSEVGDGVLELSEKEMLYAGWVLSRLMTEAEWTATADLSIFPQHPDLNRNGVPEDIWLSVPAPWGTGQWLEIWEDGQCIYQADGDYVHMGWNAVFLCTLEGEDYLLQYSPTMYTGGATYFYELFTLEGGEKQTVQENHVAFETSLGWFAPNGGTVDPDDLFDPDAVANFMDEVNGLLSHSIQLLNTDEELLETFRQEGRLVDTLSTLFDYDHEKSMVENLRDYRSSILRQASQLPPAGPG